MPTNKLIYETSPYLLQHAHNPVDWHPWGQEAMAKARNENKLLLVSIGYSACHWCHVMELESFEDPQIAELMNAHFVCVKVDREERPDVDQIYMEAVQMLSGSGGWPLNCFALPDGQPVWGGTYFPKHQWKEVLEKVSTLNRNQPRLIMDQARQLTEGIRSGNIPDLPQIPDQADEQSLLEQLRKRFDLQYGGFGRAPKFPMPVALDLILQTGHLRQNRDCMDFISLSLESMASGGIYDQVGGGFSRYSVDQYWFAPHFEKMLYDNAQLIALYSRAFGITKNSLYQRIANECITFIQREMTSGEGLFYSALDADSEGHEGLFYTWTYEELKAVVGEDPAFMSYFNIRAEGNWEGGRNILHGTGTREAYARSQGIDAPAFEKQMENKLTLLLESRKARIRPGLDDKILTGWNALMIDALCEACRAFDADEHLNNAKRSMDQLLQVMNHKDNCLHRSYKNGLSRIDGFLDDYAFVIKALISLYQCTFDESYITKAEGFTRYVMDCFYDEAQGMFFYTSSEGEALIARKTELQDNVIPSPVSTMALNLIHLAQLNHRPDYENIAEMLLAKMQHQTEKYPSYYAQWAMLSIFQKDRQEIAILGAETDAYRRQMQRDYRVATIYAGAWDGQSNLSLLQNRYTQSKTLIYRCHNKSCDLPVEHPHELKSHL